MKRYDIYTDPYGGYSEDEDSTGKYVHYEDLEPLLMAVKKLLECKGRFHTEQNFKSLSEEWEKLK